MFDAQGIEERFQQVESKGQEMIRVCLMKRENRRYYECQWQDVVTGRLRTKTTKCLSLRDAERFRAKLERALSSGESVDGNSTFDDAVARYVDEVLPSLRESSREKIMTTLRLVKKVVDPGRVSAIDETQISKIKTHLIKQGRSAFTQIGHLQNLRQFIAWANLNRLCPRVPAVVMPTRPADKMKGRAVTGEEFDRMIAAVDLVAGNAAEADSLRTLIRGLYLSGLRLSEALALHWIDDSEICIDTTSNKYPMFRVQGDAEKGKKTRMLPIAPEFWRMIESTPEDQRVGYVFKIDQHRKFLKSPEQSSRNWASKSIVKVGEAAKIVVGRGRSDGVKYASAHDLRRSFGVRWSRRVPPKILQQMMRHANIQTTMDYYVGHDADAAAEQLWTAADATNTSANSRPSPEVGASDSSVIYGNLRGAGQSRTDE